MSRMCDLWLRQADLSLMTILSAISLSWVKWLSHTANSAASNVLLFAFIFCFFTCICFLYSYVYLECNSERCQKSIKFLRTFWAMINITVIIFGPVSKLTVVTNCPIFYDGQVMTQSPHTPYPQDGEALLRINDFLFCCRRKSGTNYWARRCFLVSSVDKMYDRRLSRLKIMLFSSDCCSRRCNEQAQGVYLGAVFRICTTGGPGDLGPELKFPSD